RRRPHPRARLVMLAEARTQPIQPIERVRVGAFEIPTDTPEADGTLEWDATTLVVVELSAGAHTGVGYTYADAGVGRLIVDRLEPLLREQDGFAIGALWARMFARLRNLGQQGASAMAVSAVDVALWDLKARQLGVPLVSLLGAVRPAIPVYGSGGFTSYSEQQLREQFRGWAELGIERFKMKVGREPARDEQRVRVARAEIGAGAELYVDANSAYTRREARLYAELFADGFDVCWLEEPLPPEDLDGLRFLRGQVPAKLEIAEGEYGYDLDYFRRLLEADAADVVMPDLTRCGGITGFMHVASLCAARRVPLSSHCAPALHVHVGCAVAGLRHAEYFHDHARIERLLFDGAAEPEHGVLQPNLGEAGLGLEFKWQDAERYAV
ncbi:MAG TPA: enolase C-terminal domain-like protein, partial [Candidatus Synoicihabitans sp.]|nr:enolase C-terminal domain-like protein [Candidatus Synoicihabitans sp.]